MTPKERAALIDEIVASGPSGLGLRLNTRANLETMNDDELTKFLRKLETVREYASASGVKRPDISAKRAELAARRAGRYQRIAALRPKEKSSVLPVSISGDSAPATGVLAALKHDLTSVVFKTNLSAALDKWNDYDRNRDDHVAALMRTVVDVWLQDFGGKASGVPHFYAEIQNALQGPLRIDFNQYLEFALDRVGRDTLRILRNYLVHSKVNSSGLSEGFVTSFLAESVLAEEALESVFVGSTSGRMRETVAIDGLAKMRTFAVNYQPDLVVCVSGGGKIVGDFIAIEAKLGETPVRMIKGQDKQSMLSGGWKSLGQHRRILLVDDIAGTENLCEAHRQLTKHLEGGEIQMVAFASSLETREQLIGEGHANIFVAHVADRTIDVPWDRRGAYADKSKAHVFGDGTGAKLSVPKAQLRRVSASFLEATVVRKAISS